MLDEINSAWLPPVLDGINGLQVIVDEKIMEDATCRIVNEQLWIQSKELVDVKNVVIQFAQTSFYQVNIYNGSHIPVKPFMLSLDF